jgi:hypothetical protein
MEEHDPADFTWREWLFPDDQSGPTPDICPIVTSPLKDPDPKAKSSTKTLAFNHLSLPLRLPVRTLHLPDLAVRMMALLKRSPWLDQSIDAQKRSSLATNVSHLKMKLEVKQLGSENNTNKATDVYTTALEDVFLDLIALRLEIDKQSDSEDSNVRTDTCVFHADPKTLWLVWEDKSVWVFDHYKQRMIDLTERGVPFRVARVGNLEHEESILGKVSPAHCSEPY